MLIVNAAGTPAEFGLAYGTQAKDLIQHTVATYRALLKSMGILFDCLSPHRHHMFDVARLLKTHAPFLEDEIVAIGKAAGVSWLDLLAMNSRSELITISGAWSPSECTSMAVAPWRTKDGIGRVAQNWDWLHDMKGNQIVLRAKPEKAPAYVSFCEAGHLAKISVNEHGLAVGLNFLHAPVKERSEIVKGIPVHFLLRMVLKASTVGEAIEILRGVPRGDGANLMMADATGTIASVEISPSAVNVLRPPEIGALAGILTHANDYEAAIAWKNKPTRSNRLLYLSDNYRRMSRDNIVEILRDHEPGTVEHICAHPSGPGTSASIVSIILEPTERALWVAEGLPCERKELVQHRVILG